MPCKRGTLRLQAGLLIRNLPRKQKPAPSPACSPAQVMLMMMTCPVFVALFSHWLCKRKLPRFLGPTAALTIAASAMVSEPWWLPGP